MEILEAPEFREIILDKIRQREFSERVGVHQSDLCFCLNKQVLRRIQDYQPTDDELLLYSLGWASQRWLTGQEEDEPEVILDGITVTKDALYDGCPWELKATFQSSERPIDGSIHWMRQLAAQCKVSNATKAYLTRLCIMGNWKSIFGKKEDKSLPENRKPTLGAYLITFTPKEIESTWEWFKRRKELFLKILESGTLLDKSVALPDGVDSEWECDRCPFRGKECS